MTMRATTSSYPDVANYRVQAPDHGGPGALVLLHGLGGDLDQLWGITEGRAGGQPAAVLAADARAHGRTEVVPLGRLDFGVLAADVVALADHLRLGPKLVLVGVSMGAATALTLAIQEPAGATRSSWCARHGSTRRPNNLAAFAEIAALLRARGPVEGGARFQESVLYQEVKALSPSAATSLLAQFEKPSALERVRRLEDIPNSVPYQDAVALRAISVPTLVVAAPGDPVHPVPIAEELVSHIPASRLAVITPRDLSPGRNQADLQAAVRGFLADLEPLGEAAADL